MRHEIGRSATPRSLEGDQRRLEAATSLPALSWATVTNTPTVNSTECSVQLPLTGNAKFIRLRQP
jgi:hypothetical protein